MRVKARDLTSCRVRHAVYAVPALFQNISHTEFKIWKKNCPFLYDVIISVASQWPSLTVEWLPGHTSSSRFSEYSLLLGTHTSRNDEDSIKVATIQLPNKPSQGLDDQFAKKDGLNPPGDFKYVKKLAHDGEVNKARHNPFNPSIVATMSFSGDVFLFDLNDPAAISSVVPKPTQILRSHTEEGFGLAWSPKVEGQLLTGSGDSTVALWDINEGRSAGNSGTSDYISPTSIYRDHSAIVNDVQWHASNKNIFGSVSDDLLLNIYDIRASSQSPIYSIKAATDAVNSLSFNPFNDYAIATGSSDSTAQIWDLRRLPLSTASSASGSDVNPLQELKGHSADISIIQWSPHFESVLATGSNDRRINIWDLSIVDRPLDDNEKEEDGPSELLFMHGGHTNKISDFSWHPDLPWVIASTAEDNIVQVWKVAESVVNYEHVNDDDEENGE